MANNYLNTQSIINLCTTLGITGNKDSDGTVLVNAMYEYLTSQKFGSSQLYDGSNLDITLNNTFYNSLSFAAQAAIADTIITFDSFDTGGSRTTSGTGTRKVFALSAQDIIDYTNQTFNTLSTSKNAYLWPMYWNITDTPSTTTSPLLRSACSTSSYLIWFTNSYYGRLATTQYNYDTLAIRPAFTIDLSKITWSYYTGTNNKGFDE